jgi:mono/diheme cytochrome c family protein
MTRNILIATIFSLATAVLLGVIFIGESQRLPRSTAAITAEQLERGARDYEQYCASCHGLAGQGQVAAGAPQINNIVYRYMTPDANGNVPFDQPNGIKEKYGTIRNYIEATLYSGIRNAAMPAFGAQGTLRQDQIENITSYILAWGTNVENGGLPEAAIAAANLEATRVAPTADPNANPVTAAGLVFQTNCASCHSMDTSKIVGPGLGGLFGPDGTAAYGTQLPNGEEVNEENFYEWMRLGSAGYSEFIEPIDGEEYPRAMPGFAQLSQEQLEQLYLWLRVHDRDGNITEEGQQIIQEGVTEGDGQAAPAQQLTVVPTGQPNQPSAPDSPAGPGSTATP